jgi:hypothetical protein
MRTVKWTLVILLVLVLGSILHYTLPRHQVVRIVGVETRLETLGWNRFFYANVPTGQAEGAARDVRYIESVRPSGGELVFRNEDTGWIWPPYFKLNSSDMQARARDLVSTSENPVWVAVTYYGFRSAILSIYPNVLRVRVVDSPDVRIIPWTRIVFFTALFVFATWVWFMLRRFNERRVEPFLERLDDRRDAARGWLGRLWDRATGR